MNNLKKNNVNLTNKIFLYKCIFMVYTVFLTTEFSQMRSFTFLKIIIFGTGLLIMIYEIYKTKGRYVFGDKLLLSFIIFSTVTLLFNGGKASNFKFYIITLIQLFVLNSIEKEKSIANIKDEFKIYNLIFIFLTLIFTLSGILIYTFNFKIGVISITDVTRTDLIKGIYVVSTSAGLMCYLSLAVTIISLIIERKEIVKQKVLIYLINLLIQCYGLFLSGARGSILSFITFLIVLLFLFISNKKVRVGIIGVFVVAILSFPVYKSELLNINFLNKDIGGNFFSGRLVLWENGYKNTFRNYKLLGTGPGNMIEVTKTLSDTYLPGIEGGRMHNIYLDILCSNGILGFITFIIFIIGSIVIMYKNSFNNKISNENIIYVKVIFAIISSILVINIVESIMLYVLSIASTLFWTYMGYAKVFMNYEDYYI